MQTFLPFADFRASARVLDMKRLGKQRVEGVQILATIDRMKTGQARGGWSNHPAIKMWMGAEVALQAYVNAVIEEWVSRGYRNTMMVYDLPDTYPNPSWLGDETFHDAHKSLLLRKDPAYYSQFGWQVPHDLPPIWPVNDPTVR